MTTPTNTTTDAPSTNGTAPKQAPTRAVFVVVTVQTAYGEVSTTGHDLTVPAGTRHQALLTHVLKECIPEHLRGNSVVLHYSVHPAVVA